MSNLPEAPSTDPEEETVFSITDVFKTVILLAPILLVLMVVVLAFLGPSVGNVFSNIVSAL